MATVAIIGGSETVRSRVMAALAADGEDVEVAVAADIGRLSQLADVDGVVYLSDARVYGAHRHNDVPLTEEKRAQPNVGDTAAEERLADEQDLRRWQEANSHTPVAVLRVAMMVGAHTHPWIVDSFVGGRMLGVRDFRPPYQFVHIDDVVSAAAHAAVNGLDGTYNVGSRGWLSAAEVQAILDRRRMELPEEVAMSAVERMRRAGVSHFDTAHVFHLMHPCVLSVDRLTGTGWEPTRTNRDALSLLADTHGDMVQFGEYVTTRPEIRKAVGIAAGAIGGLAVLRMLVRRWRDAAGDSEED